MIDLHTRGASPALLSATEPTRLVRVRIEHSRTFRDGWSYSTTVEVTSAQPDLDETQRLLGQVRRLGEHERDIRNARDAQGGGE